MRNKKLFSTVVATALAATTMAMPVMAADGNSLDVNVTTKTAVVRVDVPTTMAISVNQFEMGDGGSQIYSSAFKMVNKSEIPVKVNVESTATLNATTKLLSTKSAASASNAEGEAWMAVAAQTSSGSYADGDATSTDKLTEANKNVATFVQGSGADATKGTASQVFVLDKSGTMAYKLLNANEDASKIEYAQFYELTAETAANQDALDALLANNDVYVAAAAAADGQTLTKVAKGESHTHSATEVYYTAAQDATAKASITAANLYVYGDGTAAADGEAAFRYIGKLSEAQETWTKDDISHVTIKYDITGVTDTKYAEVKPDCTYGLYKSEKGIDYENATAMNLIKGSTAVYANYSDLPFEASDIKSCVVKVDSADYAAITPVESSTALKLTVDSGWSSATSVKIYVVTDSTVYVYTYK